MDTLPKFWDEIATRLHLKKKKDIDQLEHWLKFIIAKRKLMALLEDKPKVHIGIDPAKGSSITGRAINKPKLQRIHMSGEIPNSWNNPFYTQQLLKPLMSDKQAGLLCTTPIA